MGMSSDSQFDREAYAAACSEPDVPPFDDCAELVLAPMGREWSMIRMIDLQSAVAFGAKKSPGNL